MPSTATLEDLSEPAPDPGPLDWNDDGVVILPGLVPDTVINAYCTEWWKANGFDHLDYLDGSTEAVGYETANEYGGLWGLNATRPGGWPDCTPYMRHEALHDLVCGHPIANELYGLLGEPAGVHLNLTGWVSTERNWHQDTYLNPPHVGDYYAAAWIALGDIHPDSGPFQYIPGSHRWHRLTRSRIAAAGIVDMSDPTWPKQTEEVLTPLVEAEIERRGAEVVTYLPKRGDVLIWHGRLYHRGSKANVPGAYRPALIAHYSGINHRQDMPTALTHGGGWYFPIQESGPV